MSPADPIRVTTTSAARTADLAAALAVGAQAGDVILLSGDLGAGKTVFAKGFGAALGITEPIVSPTFTLVRHYEGRIRLHHLDVYRVTHADEALDLGLAELLDDDAVVLVEWGEHIVGELGGEYLEVRIDRTEGDPDERRVAMTPTGHRWLARHAALLRALAPWGATC